jgi:hypothetical protein
MVVVIPVSIGRDRVRINLVGVTESTTTVLTGTIAVAVVVAAVVPVLTVNAVGAAVVGFMAVFMVTVKIRPVTSSELEE